MTLPPTAFAEFPVDMHNTRKKHDYKHNNHNGNDDATTMSWNNNNEGRVNIRESTHNNAGELATMKLSQKT